MEGKTGEIPEKSVLHEYVLNSTLPFLKKIPEIKERSSQQKKGILPECPGKQYQYMSGLFPKETSCQTSELNTPKKENKIVESSFLPDSEFDPPWLDPEDAVDEAAEHSERLLRLWIASIWEERSSRRRRR